MNFTLFITVLLTAVTLVVVAYVIAKLIVLVHTIR